MRNKDKSIYEFHTLINSELPFLFNKYSVKYGKLYAPSDNICINYNKKDAFHRHENPEFLYFKEGDGNIILNNEEIKVSKGLIIAVNPDTPHKIMADGDMEYYCLIPDRNFLKENGIKSDELRFHNIITDEKSVMAFIEITEAFKKQRTFFEAALKCAVLNFIITIYENCSNQSEASAFSGSIGTAVKYIEANLTSSLSLDEISFIAGISKYHFSRKFKEATGYTVINYINLKKCELARKLLSSTALSVKEVSLKCGFDNFSYFSKTFKKFMGITPSSYR